MDDPYCPGRKTRVQLGTVEGLDLQCVYPIKSDAPKRWLEVQSHYLLMPSPVRLLSVSLIESSHLSRYSPTVIFPASKTRPLSLCAIALVSFSVTSAFVVP